MSIKRSLKLSILLFGIMIVCVFFAGTAQNVFTIQDVEAGPTGDTFWVPVQDYPGDAILVKVIDKSIQSVPVLIQETGGSIVSNFVYYDSSTNQELKGGFQGIFCFKNDVDIKTNYNTAVLRTYDKKFSYAWSKYKKPYLYNSYHNKGGKAAWSWGNQSYDSSGKNPHPFTFKVKDKHGMEHDLKIGVGEVGVAAGAADAGVPEAVPGMIAGFEKVGESDGWILAKKKCDDKNHIRRRGENGIFQNVIGLSEDDFEGKSLTDKLKVFNGTKVEDNKVFCGTVGPKNFKCGTINFYKVGDLINEEQSNKLSSSGKEPSFNIIWYQMSNIKEVTKSGENFTGQRKFRNFADVGALQARPENQDAVFQLASRPNCLEGGRAYRGKDFAEIMGTMAVQGEEAASSAFPGGFARMFVDIPDIAKDVKNNGAINIFKHTNLGEFVTSGGDIGSKLKPYTAVNLDTAVNWEHKLLICFHDGIAVTTGFTCVHRPGDLRRDRDYKIDYNSANCNEKVDKPNNQLINQVPVCALDLRWQNITENHKTYSKQLLKAFYTGTILSAVKHKKYKIFLTMVGGSAFKNDISWIVEAIQAQKEYIKKYGLTVYVVFMDFPSNLAAANDRKPLYDMVKSIGGNTLEFTINNDTGNETAEWVFYEGGGKAAAPNKTEKDPKEFEKEVFSRILTDPLQFVDKPKPDPHPHPKSSLQTNLEQLKNNLSTLKNKLGSLGKKLGALKGKLGGVKAGSVSSVPKNPKFTDIKTGAEGTLQFVNLAHLIQESVGYQTNLSKPAFNIIVYNDNNAKKFRKFADVAQVMANSLNNNAVFQFASNDNPTWTSGSGQAASILPATQEAAQRRNTERNLEPLQKESLRTKNEDPADIDNIWIGIHSNIRVRGVADPHKINLILVAARSGSYQNPHTENCQKVAYDGTFLAAAKLKAPNVFLTFMGGAIFASANPREKILEAMTNAVTSYVNKFGLNVTLIYWSKEIPTDILPLTKEVGGYVCFFENENNATFQMYPGNGQTGGNIEDISNRTDEQISQKLFGTAK